MNLNQINDSINRIATELGIWPNAWVRDSLKTKANFSKIMPEFLQIADAVAKIGKDVKDRALGIALATVPDLHKEHHQIATIVSLAKTAKDRLQDLTTGAAKVMRAEWQAEHDQAGRVVGEALHSLHTLGADMQAFLREIQEAIRIRAS